MSFRLAIILYAFSFFPIPSFGQIEDSVSQEFDSAVDALLEEYYGKLSPDIVETMTDSGALSKDGMKVGQWADYSFKSCILCVQEKINYDSLIKQKDSRGNLSFIKEIGEYKNGNRQGTWYSYSTNRLSEPFDWALASIVDYLNNNKEGWEKKYLPMDSNLYEYRRVFYKDGLENGPVYGFNENGDTTLIGQNKNGLPHGLFKYIKNNFLEFSYDLTFNYGILEGESKSYYKDGNLMLTQHYSNGELNGIHRYYHPNGQLWSELEMKSNSPWTIIANFDNKGKPKDKGNLKNGNGTMKRYDEKGKLIGVDHFLNGELIRTE